MASFRGPLQKVRLSDTIVIKYLRILSSQRQPARFLAGRLLVKTGLCTLYEIEQVGYRLRFYPSNLSEQLWVDPDSREPALDFFRRYLRDGDHVVDVGANIGDTAIVSALQVGALGAVWAIEPHPVTFTYLQGNIALNHLKNIHAINSAAGETSGEVSFGDDRRDDMNKVGEGGVRVRMERLDDLVPTDSPVALLKIDVEGYELLALAGAPSLLRNTRCIYFEVSNGLSQDFGYQIPDLLRLLEQDGFALFRQCSATSVERITAAFTTNGVENLIGVRDPSELAGRTGWRLS